MKRDDLIYFAGLFDGEGCTNWLKRKDGRADTFFMEISMTDKPVIAWCYVTFGGNFHKLKYTEGRKQQWRWRLRGQAAIKLFQAVRPFLRVKYEFPK